MVVPFLWRTNKQRYSLQGEICPACAQAMFPPREVCPHCRQPTHSKVTVKIPTLLLAPAPAISTAQIAVAGDD